MMEKSQFEEAINQYKDGKFFLNFVDIVKTKRNLVLIDQR